LQGRKSLPSQARIKLIR